MTEETMAEKKRRYEELREKRELSGEELTERVDLYYEIFGKKRIDFSDLEVTLIEC